MKFWMKALVWLGLGGGIGFFAGYRVGVSAKQEAANDISERINRAEERNELIKQNYKARAEYIENHYKSEVLRLEEKLRIANDAMDALQKYKGLDTEELPFSAEEKEDEDPEMPMEEPEMPDDLEEDEDDDDEEIQPFHPQDILPFSITRSEFLANEKDYDIVKLDYYTEDCVIFDPEREEVWTHPEQLLGIGWKALFIASDSSPVKEAFIQNDTMETLYQITRIDDSFERLYEEE